MPLSLGKQNIHIYSDFLSIDGLFQAALVFRVICIVNTDLKSMKMAVKYVTVKHVVSILLYL